MAKTGGKPGGKADYSITNFLPLAALPQRIGMPRGDWQAVVIALQFRSLKKKHCHVTAMYVQKRKMPASSAGRPVESGLNRSEHAANIVCPRLSLLQKITAHATLPASARWIYQFYRTYHAHTHAEVKVMSPQNSAPRALEVLSLPLRVRLER